MPPTKLTSTSSPQIVRQAVESKMSASASSSSLALGKQKNNVKKLNEDDDNDEKDDDDVKVESVGTKSVGSVLADSISSTSSSSSSSSSPPPPPPSTLAVPVPALKKQKHHRSRHVVVEESGGGGTSVSSPKRRKKRSRQRSLSSTSTSTSAANSKSGGSTIKATAFQKTASSSELNVKADEKSRSSTAKRSSSGRRRLHRIKERKRHRRRQCDEPNNASTTEDDTSGASETSVDDDEYAAEQEHADDDSDASEMDDDDDDDDDGDESLSSSSNASSDAPMKIELANISAAAGSSAKMVKIKERAAKEAAQESRSRRRRRRHHHHGGGDKSSSSSNKQRSTMPLSLSAASMGGGGGGDDDESSQEHNQEQQDGEQDRPSPSSSHSSSTSSLLSAASATDSMSSMDAMRGSGRTPLHAAAQDGLSAIVESIMSCGGDVNALDAGGQTPLLLAASQARWAICIQLLQDYEADPNVVNAEGQLALHMVAKQRRSSADDCVASLATSAPLDDTPSTDWSRVLTLLYTRGADINCKNRVGQTPLYLCAATNDVAAARALLKLGASPNCQDQGGDSPLHVAARAGFEPMCRALVRGGANVSLLGAAGSPMAVANEAGHTGVLELLRRASKRIKSGGNASSAIVLASAVVSPSPSLSRGREQRSARRANKARASGRRSPSHEASARIDARTAASDTGTGGGNSPSVAKRASAATAASTADASSSTPERSRSRGKSRDKLRRRIRGRQGASSAALSNKDDSSESGDESDRPATGGGGGGGGDDDDDKSQRAAEAAVVAAAAEAAAVAAAASQQADGEEVHHELPTIIPMSPATSPRPGVPTISTRQRSRRGTLMETLECEAQLSFDGADGDGLLSYFKSRQFADLELQSENGAHVYCVHKCVLAYSSAYFWRLLRANGPLGAATRKHRLASVPDPNHVMPLVFHFMYSGDITIATDYAIPLLAMADRLEMPELKKKTSEFIAANIQRENAVEMLRRAFRFQSEHIVDRCLAVIARNFCYIRDDLTFVPPEYFEALLYHEQFNVKDEYKLYKLVNGYVDTWCERKPPLPKASVYRLMSAVRYLFIPHRKMKAVVRNERVPRDLVIEALMARVSTLESPDKPLRTSEPRLQKRRVYGINFPFRPERQHVGPRSYGILAWIATKGHTMAWRNPHESGRVRVTVSSIEKGAPHELVGATPTELWTKDVPASWFCVDVGSQRRVGPTFYSVRHGGNYRADSLRTWDFQGSTDGAHWMLLRRHSNDESLNAAFGIHSWRVVNSSSGPFRYFRILQTGHNSSNHNFLVLSGFELYGELFE
jgi:ankyrin repeat protein